MIPSLEFELNSYINREWNNADRGTECFHIVHDMARWKMYWLLCEFFFFFAHFERLPEPRKRIKDVYRRRSQEFPEEESWKKTVCVCCRVYWLNRLFNISLFRHQTTLKYFVLYWKSFKIFPLTYHFPALCQPYCCQILLKGPIENQRHLIGRAR
jgi:hypothetical protein